MAEIGKPKPKEDFTDSFLSDAEKGALTAIADNMLALLALKKVLLADVYYKGVLRKDVDPDPTRNAAFALVITQPNLTNEQLGADLRAQAEGARLVEMGIGRLEKFKTPEKAPAPQGNRGR